MDDVVDEVPVPVAAAAAGPDSSAAAAAAAAGAGAGAGVTAGTASKVWFFSLCSADVLLHTRIKPDGMLLVQAACMQ